MSKLIVYTGDNPQCIEGFSDSCKRSCQGALHLRKGKPVTVTDDEWEFIKTKRSDLTPKVRVVADKPDVTAPVAPTEVVAEQPKVEAEVASNEQASEKSSEDQSYDQKNRKGKSSYGKTV